MDQNDTWEVVPKQVFTPYCHLFISSAFVVLSPVGCLWWWLCNLKAVIFEKLVTDLYHKIMIIHVLYMYAGRGRLIVCFVLLFHCQKYT